ncbi:hypothetical protein Aperf_G00000119682 [Anoplocephala perfoliata]
METRLNRFSRFIPTTMPQRPVKIFAEASPSKFSAIFVLPAPISPPCSWKKYLFSGELIRRDFHKYITKANMGFEENPEGELTEIAKRGPGTTLSPEKAEEGLRRLIYEVLHCMRPCLNNGMMILPRNAVEVCRCVCPPTHFGLVCEYEFSDKANARRRRLN